jgi:hypothetical protein
MVATDKVPPVTPWKYPAMAARSAATTVNH